MDGRAASILAGHPKNLHFSVLSTASDDELATMLMQALQIYGVTVRRSADTTQKHFGLETIIVIVSTAALEDRNVVEVVNEAVSLVEHLRPPRQLLLVSKQPLRSMPAAWYSFPSIGPLAPSPFTRQQLIQHIVQAVGLATGSVNFDTEHLLASIFRQRVLWRNGKKQEALDEGQQAVQTWPDSFNTWFAWGVKLGRMPERRAEAIAALKFALQLNPQSIEAWLWLLDLYKELGQPDQAIQVSERILELDREQPYLSWESRAKILDKELQRYPEALEAYKQVCIEYPDELFMWDSIAFIYFTLEKYSEAIEAYDRYLLGYPDDGDALYNQAIAFYELDRDEDALSGFAAAIKAYQDDEDTEPRDLADAFWFYGEILQKLQRFQEAARAYTDYLQLCPDDDEGQARYQQAITSLSGTSDGS